MSRFDLYLLRAPYLQSKDLPIKFETRKAIALLAYLGVSKQPISRSTLSLLFWPESDDFHAAKALSRTLSAISQKLGKDWMDADRDSIRLNPHNPINLDVEQFDRLVASSQKHEYEKDDLCPHGLTQLKQAIELYHSDFMTGFTLRDSPAFDEWQTLQTEHYRHKLTDALERLVRGYCCQNEFKQAIPYAKRLVAHDPLHEPGHYLLMQAYAWAGKRPDSLRHYARYKQLLKAELGIEPQSQTQQLYETLHNNLPLLPPSKPVPVVENVAKPLQVEKATKTQERPYHLPTYHTLFAGRQHEIQEIGAALNDPKCQILTVTGLGGIGKTRLVVEAMASQDARFADGVYYVSLAGVQSPDLLIYEIANALNLPAGDQDDFKAHLLGYLRHREMVIILDNFEHLLTRVDTLLEIIKTAPKVKLLITSRERLKVWEEWVLEVHGLPFPEEIQETTADSYSSVQLFLWHIHRLHLSYAPSEEEIYHIMRICQLVEGMPLAIELLSGWTRILTLREIVAEMEKGLHLLQASVSNFPQQHQGIHVVFDYTWQNLSLDEQKTMRMLTVFRGGFSRAAAEKVANATFSLLGNLLNKCLIRQTGTGRFEIHELLRQYAEEKSAQWSDERQQALDRHCEYYAHFLAEKEDPLMFGVKQKATLAEVTDEIDNIRAGWWFGVEQGKTTQIEMQQKALATFFDLKGWYDQAMQIFMEAYEILSTRDYATNCKSRGLLLLQYGFFIYRAGGLEKAKEVISQSLPYLSNIDTQREKADALAYLGNVMRGIGQYTEAIAYYNESLTTYRQLNYLYGMANALQGLGVVCQRQAKYKEAQVFHEEALAIRQKINDKRGQALSLNDLANTAYSEKDYEQVRKLMTEGLALTDEIDDQHTRMLYLRNFAFVENMQNNNEKAILFVSEGYRLARELGAQKNMASSLTLLGHLALEVKDPNSSLSYFQQSLEMYKFLKAKPGIIGALNGLGGAYFLLADHTLAQDYYREALKLARELNAYLIMFESLSGIVKILLTTQKIDKAFRYIEIMFNHPACIEQIKLQLKDFGSSLSIQLPIEMFTKIPTADSDKELDLLIEEALALE